MPTALVVGITFVHCSTGRSRQQGATASAQIDRDKDARIAAFNEDGNALAGLADQRAQLLGFGDGFAIDRQDDITRLDSGSRGGTADILHDDAALALALTLLFRCQGAHSDTKPPLVRIRTVIAGDLLFVELADLDIDLACASLAPDLQAGRLARGNDGDDGRGGHQ